MKLKDKLISSVEYYDLSNESIDIISEKLFEVLVKLKYEKTNRIALRLNVESLLLSYQDHFGKDVHVSLTVSTRFGKPSFTIRIKGEEYNPEDELSEDDLGYWNENLFEDMSLKPVVSYDNKVNSIQLKLDKPAMNQIIKLLLSLVVAVGLGMLAYVLPNEVKTVTQNGVISPIYNAFLGLFSMVGLSLVLLSVISGIVQSGNITTFNKFGKRLMKGMLGVSSIIIILVGVIATFFFDFNLSNHADGSTQYDTIIQMIFDMLPQNLIAPFYEGNAMQILIIATAIGVAILALGDSAKILKNFFNQMFSVALYIMEFIEKFMPLFIVVAIVNLMWTDSSVDVKDAWKLIVACIISCLGITVIMLFATSIHNKISFVQLVKKILPTYIIALTTASSSAVHGTCVECCNQKLGMNSKISIFGISFSTSVFKPATGFMYLISCLYFAEVSKINISVMWIIILFLLSIIMSVATPPVYGGSTAVYTILFLELGIPSEYLAVILALDIVFDYIITATDKALMVCTLVYETQKIDMLDKSILRKKI